MKTFKGKTVIITGSSRGIGRAIALKLAKFGANIVIVGKSDKKHQKLPGTIYTVADEVEKYGGNSLALKVDVRYESEIEEMVDKTVKKFGGIDILINNAGAIKLTNTSSTSVKSYDLMNSINSKASFFSSKLCLPYLKKSSNAHILNMSPPITFNPKWIKNNLAYTISKYGMTLCTLGMAEEFKEYKISVNSLWPKTAIATSAIEWIMGKDAMKHCRKTDIMSDAAYYILTTSELEITGKTLLDEDILRSSGVTDFEKYACCNGMELYGDFYVD